MTLDKFKAIFILNSLLYTNLVYAQESEKLTGFQQYLVTQGITNSAILAIANFAVVLGVAGAFFGMLWLMSLVGKNKATENTPKKNTPKWLANLGMFVGYSLLPLFLGTGFILGVAENFTELNRDMHVIKQAVSTGFQFLFFFGGAAMVIFGVRSGVRILKGKEPF